MRSRWVLAWLAPLIFVGAQSLGAEGGGPVTRAALTTLEGVVLGVGTAPGESDLQLISVRLDIGRNGEREVEVLLAPAEALADIGFVVEPGDRLKVRVFTREEGPARAQKALNLTRSAMVRFRTLHQVPVWNSAGVWQGGPQRRLPAPPARGYRRGASGAKGNSGRF